MAAGILGPKLRRWDLLICAFGLALLPAAAAFALPLGSIPAFILLTASFCAGQLAYGLFFDLAGAAAQLVLLPTAAAIFAAGLASRWLRGLLRGGD